MKLTRYFPSEDEAYAFASGIEEANDGNIHTVAVCKSIDHAQQYVVSWHNENKRETELPSESEPMTPQEYVREHKGTLCPVCRSEDIEGSTITIDASHAYQDINCLECEAHWVGCYELSGYDNLRR